MAIDWKGWKPYFCRVNGELASILVDLDLRKSVPIATQPWLLWVWVYFKSPRPDGLSDGNAAPTLYQIEDVLNLALSETCRAIPCGRITTQGRREFYFYGKTNDNFRQAVEAGMSGFDGYRFDLGEQKDPLWAQYLNVLYPSSEQLQCIANLDLLDLLTEKGDVHTVPREVQHWMYFRTKTSRGEFRKAVSAARFEVASEKKLKGDLPFSISVVRTQPIDQGSIDNTVVELMRLSQQFDGEYDGWETPVITQ